MADLQVFPDEPFDFDEEAASKYPEMERLLTDTESADEEPTDIEGVTASEALPQEDITHY